MHILPTQLAGLFLLEPQVFGDERGYFFESYNQRVFADLGIEATFVQDNESCSQKDVLRGLHFQRGDAAQGKLVRVVQGAVRDVAVDLRSDSPTFGQHEVVELSAQNKRMFYVPAGFAHGFLALEDDTIFQYKCTNFYNKDAEGALRWDDPDLAIDWGVENPLVSEKDQAAPSFAEYRA